MHRRLVTPGLCAALCMSLLAAAMLPTFAAHRAPPLSPPAPTEQNARIPDALLPRVNASFAADDPAYAVTASPDDPASLRAANPANHLTATFAPDAARFDGEHSAGWSLRLAAVGKDAVPTAAPLLANGRVEYRRGDLTEWYLNGPLGVEQGFTLASPPSTGDTLALTLTVGTGSTPHLDDADVTLSLPGGETLRYGHLRVTDATGRHLPAHLSVAGDAIAITADLAGAAYPVTVDPLLETKKLTRSDGAAGDYFGWSVAMSADGSRVIVGAPGKMVGMNQYQGVAYIYSGTNYAAETKLVASDGAIFDQFGYPVAMSADGARVMVGAYQKKVGANTYRGEAYIYSGSNYATETKLLASDGLANDNFGGSVAMSRDGTKVIVGAPGKTVGANTTQGVAYIYSDTNYAAETKLLASDGALNDSFGGSVAMSADGSRLIVGAGGKKIGANTSQGVAYIYSGSNYAETKLLASDGAAYDSFGGPVAMSADGARVMVGAFQKKIGANTYRGEAYIYSGSNYATETKLLASDGALNDYFGRSVAMSADGSRVIVGAPGKKIGANNGQGAAYAYSGTNYATEQRLVASDGAMNDSFGISVAMSGDGTTVIVGAFTKSVGANTIQGAAYLFAAPLPGPLPPPMPPGPPSGSPGPAPLPIVRPGSGGGSPNPLPPRRP